MKNMDEFALIILFLSFAVNVFVKLICELTCEYKFLLCKGHCSRCYNWKCRFFEIGK